MLSFHLLRNTLKNKMVGIIELNKRLCAAGANFHKHVSHEKHRPYLITSSRTKAARCTNTAVALMRLNECPSAMVINSLVCACCQASARRQGCSHPPLPPRDGLSLPATCEQHPASCKRRARVSTKLQEVSNRADNKTSLLHLQAQTVGIGRMPRLAGGADTHRGCALFESRLQARLAPSYCPH